jgi:hypothetical protein
VGYPTCPRLDWIEDAAAGAWIEASVRAFGAAVESLLPPVFGAYARIRHGEGRLGTLVSNEVEPLAGMLARHTATPSECWFAVWEGYGWIRPQTSFTVFMAASELTFDRAAAERAANDAVEAFASTLPAPSLLLPRRNLMLYRGPLAHAGALLGFPARQSPNLWWPADHAWCVATDIDLDATYVGGTGELVTELIESQLAADRVAPTDSITG